MLDFLRVKESVAVLCGKRRASNDRFHMCSDVIVEVRDGKGNIKSRSLQKNLRTNAGADFWSQQLFGTGTPSATLLATRMAVTTNSTAAGATDTTLTSEETTNGLQRTGALTPTHTSGATSSVFTNTFTYTGSSSKAIAKVGLFTDTFANGGTLVLETVLSSTATVNASGDTCTITWTVNF